MERHKKGTTFLEAVVAISIFLIVLLPLMNLNLTTLKHYNKSKEIRMKIRSFENLYIFLKSKSYDELKVFVGETDINLAKDKFSNNILVSPNIDIVDNLSLVSDVDFSVDITLSIKEFKTVEREKELEALFASLILKKGISKKSELNFIKFK